MPGCLPPILKSAFPGEPVVGKELVPRVRKTYVLRVQLFLHIHQFAVGQEVADAPEEREGVLVDHGMGSGFDKSQIGEGFFGKELLVAETHEPVTDLVGVQTEIAGVQFLVETRVAHARIHEDAFAGEDIEDVGSG